MSSTTPKCTHFGVKEVERLTGYQGRSLFHECLLKSLRGVAVDGDVENERGNRRRTPLLKENGK